MLYPSAIPQRFHSLYKMSPYGGFLTHSTTHHTQLAAYSHCHIQLLSNLEPKLLLPDPRVYPDRNTQPKHQWRDNPKQIRLDIICVPSCCNGS